MIISVVVPIYNVSRFLPACLDSIVHQTYSDLDIILIDDGSTDDCPQICDAYSQRDDRIRVIHKQNGGLSDARNVGIECAKGQYITFVDSDDVIAVDMIEYLYYLMQKYQVDMSCCQMRRISESNEPMGETLATEDILIQGGALECMRALLTNSLFNVVAWSKLYKTSDFKNVRYPKGKLNEDVFTTYKIVAHCERIIIGGERKYYYRVREGSIMTMNFKPAHMDAVEAKITLNNFVEKQFPSLVGYSQAGIVYAANICSLRIAKSNEMKEVLCYIPKIQALYRQYEWSFLRYSRNKISAKLYSILAYVQLNLLVHFLHLYYHGRK